MVKKKSVKRSAIVVPKSSQELADFIRQIGEHRRILGQIEAKLNDKIEKTKANAVADSEPHQAAIDLLVEGVYVYAEGHRDELTEDGKKKTVTLPTGKIGWRMTPPAVFLKGVKEVIKRCKDLGLERFIRIKEEIDKEAMLKEPGVSNNIRGVSIAQREEFVVEPSEVSVEISRDTKKLKKALPPKK